MGRRGLLGVDGVPGEKDDTGDPGPAGAKGDTGDQGPAGAKGDTGSADAKGDTGSVRAKGDTGDLGPVGAKGDTGSASAKGDTGDQGPAGAKGDTGSAGAKGDTGIDGVSPDAPGWVATTAYIGFEGVWTNIASFPLTITATIPKNNLIKYELGAGSPQQAPCDWSVAFFARGRHSGRRRCPERRIFFYLGDTRVHRRSFIG